MFGWFKKKTPELSPELRAVADRLIAPQALAVAITECVADYAAAVKAARVEFPAHRRKRSNVETLWTDIRLEAMRPMFGFGQASLLMLADVRRQTEFLKVFLEDRPHLEFPQPRGEVVADTWQGVWQVYLYLDTVGTEVMDRETDRQSLKRSGRSIISQITADAAELNMSWHKFEASIRNGSTSLLEMPKTIVDVFWEDVTSKTKSIALSVIFGPSYESGIALALNLVEEQGSEKEVEMFKRSLDRVRSATKPEEIREPP